MNNPVVYILWKGQHVVTMAMVKCAERERERERQTDRQTDRQRESAQRAVKLNYNNYIVLYFEFLITVEVLKHLCVFVSLLDPW